MYLKIKPTLQIYIYYTEQVSYQAVILQVHSTLMPV